MRIAQTVLAFTADDRSLVRGLKLAAAALAIFAAMCSTASAQCPNGQCAVPQSSFATPVRSLVQRAEPVRSAAHFARSHPIRRVLGAERRAMRNVFARQ